MVVNRITRHFLPVSEKIKTLKMKNKSANNPNACLVQSVLLLMSHEIIDYLVLFKLLRLLGFFLVLLFLNS